MSGLQPRIFLQDNFPVHLAPRIDSWFSKNNDLNVIRLPKKSPDLMPLCQLHELLVTELNTKGVVPSINVLDDLNNCFKSICEPHIVESLFLEMPSTLKYIISHNGELRKMWSSRKIQREFSFQWQKKIIVFTVLFNLQTVRCVPAFSIDHGKATFSHWKNIFLKGFTWYLICQQFCRCSKKVLELSLEICRTAVSRWS